MNENLNLVEILKDCTKGMELDCTMYDDVTFDGIMYNRLYPIKVCVGGRTTIMLTKYGQCINDDFAKCVIFPKGKTTWEGFVPPHKFKDGDIVATSSGNWIGITTGGYAHSYMPTYCVLSHNREVKLYFGRKEKWGFNRLATEKEKQKLFDAIKEHGYKWNAETKTLEKLITPKFKVGDIVRHKNIRNVLFTIRNLEEDYYFCGGNFSFLFDDQDEYELVSDKFDLKNLNAFDKVLVRYNNTDYWRCDFFSHELDGEGVYKYACIKSVYKRCIPYNEETKHLVGTHEEAPEYYRYWED